MAPASRVFRAVLAVALLAFVVLVAGKSSKKEITHKGALQSQRPVPQQLNECGTSARSIYFLDS